MYLTSWILVVILFGVSTVDVSAQSKSIHLLMCRDVWIDYVYNDELIVAYSHLYFLL